MMPHIDLMRLPMNASCTVLMMGMPPATAASKWIGVLCCFDRANSSAPRSASKALFPVTTGFPRQRARATMSNANPVPPINSTTIFTAGSSTMACQSVVISDASTVSCRAFSLSRTRMRRTCISMAPPQRCWIRSPLRCRARITPVPTVPQPAKPMP